MKRRLWGLAGAGLMACASSETISPPAAAPDGGIPDAAPEGAAITDASGTDANGPDANRLDANGPGVVDAVCSFNADCQSALRCECDEATGCACKAGARGTGQNGVDTCTTGNTCASAICVEGPPGAGSFCSAACATSDECTGKLPLCQTVSFVGRICVRTPPP